MAIVLALASAIVVGSGDFFGGMAARHGRVLAVVMWIHLIGAGAAVVLAVAVGGDPQPADFAWGAAAGLAGAVGVVALYLGFNRSRMGVVAPVSAVVAAGLPVVYGVATGDEPSAVVFGGLLVGVVAIALISRPDETGPSGSVGAGVVRGVAAGVAFGALFILFSRVSADAGAWPVLPARAAGAALLVAAILATRDDRMPVRAAWPVLILGATVAVAGTGLFVLAFQEGLVSVVSVLASMYPAATVAWARIIYSERLNGLQWSGVGLALVAVGMIAGG